MTKPTRLFLFVSGGILAAGLGTGLVAAYVGGLQNLSLLGSSGPSELAYLPADAKVVAFANVREIMDSELHQKIQAMVPRNGEGLARFQEETGVDVTKDVDYVLAALSGDTAAGPEQGHPLVMAHGHFDNVRIEGLVRSRGGVVEDYKGIRFLKVSEPSGAMDVALAFVEPGLIAMGADAAVRQAIDGHNGTANATGNADLSRLVKEAADGNAWVVARFDALSAAAGKLPPEVAQRLPAINWVTLTGHVNGGLSLAARAEARDDAAAKNLRDVLQGILALAKLQTGQRADITAIIDSIQLGGEGKNVSLSLAVPIEVVDHLASLRTQAGVTPPPAAPQPPAPPQAPAAP